MECPSCHSQAPDGQRFCPTCGASLQDAPSTEPRVDPLIGTILNGKYRIVRLLGEGGMGAVYLGEQQLGTKKRNVAIKTLHPHLSKDPKILARFEREVGTVAELEHPNTIQVYDYGQTEAGILYIVMEYVQGRNLAELLEQEGGAMQPARVDKIMTQICGSLEEAHGRGIIHRDLKPDNVVLTERAGQKDWVKVLDFGIAKRSTEEDKNEQKLTQQGMVLGTPPYMSPEQFTGRPIDARSDIYSLAIMACEMLTGRLPFTANTAWEWATQHMTAPPMDIDQLPFHERVPERMKVAIRKALAKIPEERYPTVRAFCDAFTGGAAAAQAEAPAGALGSAPGAMAVNAKGKTEIGAPIDFGQAAAPYGSPPGAPPVQAHWGTPAAGNVAFPTPGAGIPQPPARTDGRGGTSGGGGAKTGMLLGIAGVIGLLSVVAIVFAMRGSSSSNAAVDPLAPTAPPQADLTATNDAGAAAAAATNEAAESPTIAPLAPGHAASPPPAAAHHDAGKATATPPATPGTKPGTPPANPPPATTPTNPAPQAPPVTTPPVVTPPAASEPIECLKARTFKATGNMTLYSEFAKQCAAKGGHP